MIIYYNPNISCPGYYSSAFIDIGEKNLKALFEQYKKEDEYYNKFDYFCQYIKKNEEKYGKYLKDNDVLKAIDLLTKDLKGSYALGIIIDGDNKLYALRKDSPLLIGIGDKENFLASDITAIVKHTNKYILLEPKEIAVLEEDKYTIYIIQEFVSGKDLLEYITSKRSLDEKEACHIFQQLIFCVEYILGFHINI